MVLLERTAGRARRSRTPVALALVLLLAAACHAHSHRIGGGPTGIGEESARQYYIFFGLLQLNEVNVQRMAGDLTSYEIVSEKSFVDYLLLPVLGVLTITSRTVTVRR